MEFGGFVHLLEEFEEFGGFGEFELQAYHLIEMAKFLWMMIKDHSLFLLREDQ
jgi:hypothetical protein